MPTEETSAWTSLVVEPVREMLTQVLGYLPKLLGALLILIIGWIVARVIRRLVDELLKLVRFDSLADKAGISGVLEKGNVKVTAREVVSGLVYWLIMIMVLVMTVNALGLPRASDILESIFAYVPRVIVAILAIIIGLFLASFVAGIVRLAAANANMPKPDVLAGICRWVIIVFAAAVALTELDIASMLVATTFNIILAGVVFAAALAIGLGGKDAVAKYIEELKHKKN
jgi:small-conductance mechanosensitive channel